MNVTFIGMSGAGKSHVGKRYAREHEMDFIDIDTEMESEYGKPLQEILDELGEETFLEKQADQVLALAGRDNLVISPGGSVVYTERAMKFLKANSKIIYLDVPLSVIESRINPSSRGIVGMKNKTFAELYEERSKLYQNWADEILQVEAQVL